MFKRTFAILLMLALVWALPMAQAAYSHYSEDAVVAEDVEGFVITAWDKEPFDLYGKSRESDNLVIQYVGEGNVPPLPENPTNEAMITYADDAWHWAEQNRGYGDFCLAKVNSEKVLRIAYDGTTAEESTADGAYYDYTRRFYAGTTPGQVKIVVVDNETMTAYIKFHCEVGAHKALRVQWIPDEEGAKTGSWEVTNFYTDNVRSYKEMEVCADFSYYDYCGNYVVNTEQTGLNVRDTPNGEVLGSVKKGSSITIYNHEEIADNGMSYTLMHKTSKPDKNGKTKIEYYGWVATEYLGETDSLTWVLAD